MATEEKISILYVDDEKVNLLAFRANFRRDYKVYTASSGAEGKKLLEENDIKIVVADQRMPKMTGVEFFEWILQDHPNTIRVLLTGFSDISAVIDAINKGKVYSYVTKPWNENELQQTFQSAFEEYERAAYYESLEKRYQQLFEQSSDAVLTLNNAGQITGANSTATELLHFTDEELVSTNIQDLVEEVESVESLIQSDRIIDATIIDKFQSPISCSISVINASKDKGSKSAIQLLLKKQ